MTLPNFTIGQLVQLSEKGVRSNISLGRLGLGDVVGYSQSPQLIRVRPHGNKKSCSYHRGFLEVVAPVKPSGPVSAEVSRVMAEMGRRGGLIGGKRRLETMTPEARSAVASKAARARWAKRRP